MYPTCFSGGSEQKEILKHPAIQLGEMFRAFNQFNIQMGGGSISEAISFEFLTIHEYYSLKEAFLSLEKIKDNARKQNQS